MLFSGQPVAAVQTNSDWQEGAIELTSKLPDGNEWTLPFSCGSDVAFIKIANEPNLQRACVYGESGGFRVARYVNNQYKTLTVAAYATDQSFYVVRDICTSTLSCVYSQSADTLLFREQVGGYYDSELRVYSSISRHLQRKFDPLVMNYYYSLSHRNPESFPAQDGSLLPVGRMGVSRSGRWVAVEYTDRGVGLINMETREIRRVAVIESSTVHTITYELAAADDGRAVAFSSSKTNPRIVAIDPYCGDRIAASNTRTFPVYVRQCNSIYPEPYTEVSQYVYSSLPYFTDTQSVLFAVYTRTQSWTFTYSVGQSAPVHEPIQYLALGDSFTSGEGEESPMYYLEGTKSQPHACHVSLRSYPYLVDILGSALNMACSGAVMKDLTGAPNYSGQGGRLSNLSVSSRSGQESDALNQDIQGVLPQITFLQKYNPEYATVSVGGNDTGFMGKLKSCLGPGTCAWAEPGADRQAVAKEIETLHTGYISLFQRLKQASPSTHFRTVGYPQIINSSEGARCLGVEGVLLNLQERRFIEESIKKINSVMQQASIDVGFEYISIEEAYTGSKLCDETPSPAMNGIRLGDAIAPIASLPELKVIGAESFHPTSRGHELAAAAVRVSFESHFEHGQYGYVQSRAGQGTDEYWMEGGAVETDAVGRYYMYSADEYTVHAEDAVLEEVIPEGVFAPEIPVQVRVGHTGSATEVFTDELGGAHLEAVFAENTETGVYPLLITGESAGGETITAYRFIHYFSTSEDEEGESDEGGAIVGDDTDIQQDPGEDSEDGVADADNRADDSRNEAAVAGLGGTGASSVLDEGGTERGSSTKLSASIGRSLRQIGLAPASMLLGSVATSLDGRIQNQPAGVKGVSDTVPAKHTSRNLGDTSKGSAVQSIWPALGVLYGIGGALIVAAIVGLLHLRRQDISKRV